MNGLAPAFVLVIAYLTASGMSLAAAIRHAEGDVSFPRRSYSWWRRALNRGGAR